MDSNDYVIAWVSYIAAALILSVLTWRVFRRFLPRPLAWLLECWLLALLLTPWYVLEDQEILAPAFIVFALDTITVEPLAGIRALTPLVLALLGATVLAVVASVGERLWRPVTTVRTPATELQQTTPGQHEFMLDSTPEAAGNIEPEGFSVVPTEIPVAPAAVPEDPPEAASSPPVRKRKPRKRKEPELEKEEPASKAEAGTEHTATPAPDATPRRRRKFRPVQAQD